MTNGQHRPAVVHYLRCITQPDLNDTAYMDSLKKMLMRGVEQRGGDLATFQFQGPHFVDGDPDAEFVEDLPSWEFVGWAEQVSDAR